MGRSSWIGLAEAYRVGRREPVRLGGFEDLSLADFARAAITGTSGRNLIRAEVCATRIDALGGDDSIGVDAENCRTVPAAERGSVQRLGRGDDIGRGTGYADLIVGGTGRDRAVGRSGADTCRAEIVYRCGGRS